MAYFGVPIKSASFCVAIGIATAIASPVLAGDGEAATTDASATPASPDKSFYTLFDPTPDNLMRSFATDRPPKANSAYTVDAGHFQLETDLGNYTYSNYAGVNTRSFQALDPVWKLGLTNWADFELQFNGYQYSASHDDATGALSARGYGFGDVVLRTKVNLFGNDAGNAALAIIPYVKLPSGTAIISNGEIEGGVIAPLQVNLPQDFGLTFMTEFDALKDADGTRRHANFVNLVNLGHPVPSITGLTAVVEFYSSVGTDRATPPIYTFDTALTYALTPNVQLDAGFDLGLNQAAPKQFIFAGLSTRF